MSQREKLVARLRQRPRDFTWDELERLLRLLGYTQAVHGKTGGSRRRFVHPTAAPVILHQPHPGNVLKRYQVDQVLDVLEEEGLV